MQAITTSRPLLYPSPQANKRQGLMIEKTQYEARFANGPPSKSQRRGKGTGRKRKEEEIPLAGTARHKRQHCFSPCGNCAQQEAVAQRGFQKVDN